jgi:hypothetical protein
LLAPTDGADFWGNVAITSHVAFLDLSLLFSCNGTFTVILIKKSSTLRKGKKNGERKDDKMGK